MRSTIVPLSWCCGFQPALKNIRFLSVYVFIRMESSTHVHTNCEYVVEDYGSGNIPTWNVRSALLVGKWKKERKTENWWNSNFFLCKIIWSEIYLRFINIYSRMTRHVVIWACWWGAKCRRKKKTNHTNWWRWRTKKSGIAALFYFVVLRTKEERFFSVSRKKVKRKTTMEAQNRVEWNMIWKRGKWTNIDVLFSVVLDFQGFSLPFPLFTSLSAPLL